MVRCIGAPNPSPWSPWRATVGDHGGNLPKAREGVVDIGLGDPLVEVNRDLVADVLAEGAKEVPLDRQLVRAVTQSHE